MGCAAVVLAYQHLAQARPHLKHSVLSECTVLLSRWFQAMIVLGKKECIHVLFSVAMCSIDLSMFPM